MPRLEPIWQKYKDKGLAVVAVETNQRGKAALKFIEEKKLTFHFLETHVGPDDPIDKVFHIKGLPLSMIIDAEGRILFLHSGFKEGDEAKLEKMVQKTLGL